MTKIILPYDPGIVVHRTDVSGWMVVADRTFFGDGPNAEHAARMHACTHTPCPDCGRPWDKRFSTCNDCSQKRRMKERKSKYLAMPEVPFDPKMVTVLRGVDTYFFDPQAIEDYADGAGIPISQLDLVVCEPNIAKEIDPDEYYSDDIPEERVLDEIDPELAALFEAVNAYIREKQPVLSWRPGKQRTRYVP